MLDFHSKKSTNYRVSVDVIISLALRLITCDGLIS